MSLGPTNTPYYDDGGNDEGKASGVRTWEDEESDDDDGESKPLHSTESPRTTPRQLEKKHFGDMGEIHFTLHRAVLLYSIFYIASSIAVIWVYHVLPTVKIEQLMRLLLNMAVNIIYITEKATPQAAKAILEQPIVQFIVQSLNSVGIEGTRWQAVNVQGRLDSLLLQPLRFIIRFIGVSEIITNHFIHMSYYGLGVNGLCGVAAGFFGLVGVVFALQYFVMIFALLAAGLYLLQLLCLVTFPLMISNSEYMAMFKAISRGWSVAQKVAVSFYKGERIEFLIPSTPMTLSGVLTLAGLIFIYLSIMFYFLVVGFFLVEMVWSLYRVMAAGGTGKECMGADALLKNKGKKMSNQLDGVQVMVG